MKHQLKQISAVLLLWTTSIITTAAEPTTTEQKSPAPKNTVEPGYEATEKEIKFPGVTINRAAREVRIDAVVCLQDGILEYVVCRPDTYEHESIFTTTAKPEFVHAALLLCRLKPTPRLPGMSGLWAEKAMKKKQSRVKIEVEWKEQEILKRVNLTSLLKDRPDYEDESESKDAPKNDPKKEPLVQDAWIFAGSFIHVDKRTNKSFYAANISGILVGVWPDPTTVIQYGISNGNPYEGKHLGLEINEELVPKIGTKVKLVFSLHDTLPKKASPKK